MRVIMIPVGMIGTNCCLAYDETSLEGIIVDPGDDAEKILHIVNAHHVTVTHILLTHGHFDHTMAVASLKRETNAAVCIHALDAKMLLSAKESLLYHFFDASADFDPIQADILWNGGEVFSAAGQTITVRHTPGHTPGSVCYDTGDVLFSGDTLFASSCGRCDLPGGNTAHILSSLRYLHELSGDRIVYPGHERQTTLDTERMGNYAMRQAVAIKR